MGLVLTAALHLSSLFVFTYSLILKNNTIGSDVLAGNALLFLSVSASTPAFMIQVCFLFKKNLVVSFVITPLT